MFLEIYANVTPLYEVHIREQSCCILFAKTVRCIEVMNRALRVYMVHNPVHTQPKNR